ncbi:MAG: phosphohydrolase, partial [Sphaerochaetaceae bacterium]
RLPQEVIDIVAQHHGNDVIAIFLKEAEEAARAEGSSAVVEAQDYAYNGLVPQSREAAIVMLADGVEAASRSIAKPTLLKYERLVNQIFMGKIERKQLISSGLSITDLDTISFVFVQFLTGRDHKRIEYPNQQQEQKSEK